MLTHTTMNSFSGPHSRGNISPLPFRTSGREASEQKRVNRKARVFDSVLYSEQGNGPISYLPQRDTVSAHATAAINVVSEQASPALLFSGEEPATLPDPHATTELRSNRRETGAYTQQPSSPRESAQSAAATVVVAETQSAFSRLRIGKGHADNLAEPPNSPELDRDHGVLGAHLRSSVSRPTMLPATPITPMTRAKPLPNSQWAARKIALRDTFDSLRRVLKRMLRK